MIEIEEINEIKKVITFSLWGDKPEYTIGAIKNAELAKLFYPNFECWFYIHKESVPYNIINTLESHANVKIILKYGDLTKCKPMMWRFEAIDNEDVEIMMSRDTDTRILLREKLAVDEWLRSDKVFHIMRDHPYHENKIMGGMFGTKKIKEIEKWTDLFDKINQYSNRDYDQDFLRDNIYPIIKENSLIHASFNKIENHAYDFPISYDKEYKFVGEYIYEDDTRCVQHVEYLRSVF